MKKPFAFLNIQDFLLCCELEQFLGFVVRNAREQYSPHPQYEESSLMVKSGCFITTSGEIMELPLLEMIIRNRKVS